MVTLVVLTYILILANRRTVLGNAVNGRGFRVPAVTAVSLLLVGQTVLGFLGVD